MTTTEIEAYQVEVDKRGRTQIVELLVGTVRGTRGRRNLVGEAVMSDPYTAIIEFQVKHAANLEDLLDRFIRQLLRRGYRPSRWRSRQGGLYGDWATVDESRFDLSELEAKHEVQTQEI
jgi:hypothetical protein